MSLLVLDLSTVKYAGAAVLAPDISQQSDMRRLAGTFLNSDNLIPAVMIKAIRLWVLFII